MATHNDVRQQFLKLCYALGLEGVTDNDTPVEGALVLRRTGNKLYTIEKYKRLRLGRTGGVVSRIEAFDIFGTSTPFSTGAELIRHIRFTIGLIETVNPPGYAERMSAYWNLMALEDGE